MKAATKAKSAKPGKKAATRPASAKKAKASPNKKARLAPLKKVPVALAPKEPVAPPGLKFGEFEALRRQLDLSLDQLAASLGLSRATIERRKAAGRLTTDESNKVVRFARLLGHAAHLLGGLDEARRWLKTPQRGLSGAVPLERAQTEAGAREVENLLARPGHGALPEARSLPNSAG